MTVLVSMTFDCPWGGMETETDREKRRERQREGVQTDCVFLSLYVKQISPHGTSNMSKTLTQIPHSPQLQISAQHQNICQLPEPQQIPEHPRSLVRKYHLTLISAEPITS